MSENILERVKGYIANQEEHHKRRKPGADPDPASGDHAPEPGGPRAG